MDIFECERNWAEQLKTKSLVVQIEYEDSDAISVMKRLGYLLQQGHTNEIYRSYPAAFLVGLNYVASADTDGSSLWPEIFKRLNDMDSGQSNQSRVAKLHRSVLEKFGLARFEHPLGRIGEIQLHAGIPVHSQDKFIRYVIRKFKETPGLTGHELNQMVRSIPRDRVAASSLDAKIWHFINQAGSVADDFVDLCIEILDVMQFGAHDDTSGKGLPPRVIDEIIKIVTELGSSRLSRGGVVERRVGQPKLTWPSSSENQLEIILPSVPESWNAAVRWDLDFGDRAVNFNSAQSIAGLSEDLDSYPASTPTSLVSISSTGVGEHGSSVSRSWSLGIYSEDLPFIIFDAEGNADFGKGPLEPNLIKILYPSQVNGEQPVVSVEGRHASRTTNAPLGWDSEQLAVPWVTQEIDLSEAASIEIRLGKAPPFKRAVAARRKPIALDNGLVVGAFDQEGNQIFSAFPEIEVFVQEGDASPWSYEVRDEDRSLLFSALVSPLGSKIAAPSGFQDSGTYKFKVTRGLGQTITFSRTIIFGLSTDAPTSVRNLRPDGQGLAPLTLTASRAGFPSTQIVLGSTERSCALKNSELGPVPIIIRPAYEFLELFNTLSKRKSEWIVPTKSNIEHLETLQLFLYSPESKHAELFARWADGTIHTVRSRTAAPRFRFNLGELRDMALERGAFELEILTDGDRRIRAGTCYPKNLFVSFEASGDGKSVNLEFPGNTVPAGLEICFFAPNAPWTKPVRMALDEPEVKLPEEISHFGGLDFSVAISSPWAPHDFGRSVNLEDQNTGHVSTASPNPSRSDQEALAAWISSGGVPPVIDSLSGSIAWSCFLNADALDTTSGIRAYQLKSFARSQLEKAKDAVTAYSALGRSRSESVQELLDSGIFSGPYDHVPVSAYDSSGKPLLAAMGSLGDSPEPGHDLLDVAADAWGFRLPSLEGDDFTPPPLEIAKRKIKLLHLGEPSYKFILNSGEDATQSLESGWIPGKFLDGGTIAQIFVRLATRTEEITKGMGVDWVNEVTQDLAKCESAISKNYQEIASMRPVLSPDEAKEIRGIRTRIVNWPAISLRLALLLCNARRGHATAIEVWDEHKDFYIKMSRALPSMVEMDLVLAEITTRELEKEHNDDY